MIGNQMSNHTSNFNAIYAINQSPIFVRLVMNLYSPNLVNLNLFYCGHANVLYLVGVEISEILHHQQCGFFYVHIKIFAEYCLYESIFLHYLLKLYI